jgi:mxaD protein
MAESSTTVEVKAPPDELWALVGDFGAVGDYMDGIDSCRVEGDDRVLETMGLTIRERLVERDEAARSITYSIVDGVPCESHRATVSVEPRGEGCAVTWQVSASPDEMLPIFADAYRKALEGLAARYA